MISVDKNSLTKKARELGMDLVGLCPWEDLQSEAPDYDKPLQIGDSLATLIVLIKRIPIGVSTCADPDQRQYANGRLSRYLEEETGELAYWLEAQGHPACVLQATHPDTRRQPLGYSSPAGQGSLLLRQAAVKAGLGSLGLNTMLLTEEYGPRVIISGILTDLHIEYDKPLEKELCLGLEECGRCAKICPAQAIPLKNPNKLSLTQLRSLDSEACAEVCQPYGAKKMSSHLKKIFSAQSLAERRQLVAHPDTLKIWHSMSLQRQGGVMGCMACEQVCPVGKDYKMIEATSLALLPKL